MPRVLKGFLYLVAFFISFVFFVYWLFPMEAVKDRLIGAMEKQLGPEYQVDIEEIATYHITGVKLESLTIAKMREGKKLTMLTAERVWMRVGLFSLIFGNPKLKFELQIGEAQIEGRSYQTENGYRVQLTFDHLDVGQIPLVGLKTGLHLISDMEGSLEMTYNPKEPLRTVGKVEWSIDRLQIRKGNLNLGEMGSFPIPDLDLASKGSEIKLQIEGGSMQLEAAKLQGKDFNLNLQGRLFLAQSVSRYRINWKGEFQFSEVLWKILDPILPEPFASNLKAQKSPAGNYPITVSGQLSAPQIYSGAVQVYPFKPF